MALQKVKALRKRDRLRRFINNLLAPAASSNLDSALENVNSSVVSSPGSTGSIAASSYTSDSKLNFEESVFHRELEEFAHTPYEAKDSTWPEDYDNKPLAFVAFNCSNTSSGDRVTCRAQASLSNSSSSTDSCPLWDSGETGWPSIYYDYNDQHRDTQYAQIIPPFKQLHKSQQDSNSRQLCSRAPNDEEAVQPGHVALYVGQERKRFVISEHYQAHHLFQVLLNISEEDHRHHRQEKGRLISCEPPLFEHLLRLIDAA